MVIAVIYTIMIIAWGSMIRDAFFTGEAPDPTTPRTPLPPRSPQDDLPIWKRKY
jgi:hypothetical protein